MTEIKILVLEDQEYDYDLLVLELQKAIFDFQVRHALNIREYKTLLKEHNPDLVLSDYNVPGTDIFEAFDLLHAQDPDVPFIVVSGELKEEIALDLIVDQGPVDVKFIDVTLEEEPFVGVELVDEVFEDLL